MKNKSEISGFILIASMYCVGMYTLPLQLMRFDLSLIPGDLGDARLNNYFLEHGYKWLTGQVASFWDAPFLYPTVRTMSFSDNHLGTLPIYALFRFLEFDRETSYQIWFLVIFTLNYFSCAWVLRKLSINPLGAAVGAFIFSFSLPVLARIGHCQLLPRFMIPFAFYFAFKYFENPTNKLFGLTCFSVALQFYLTMYMGLFLSLGLICLYISNYILKNKTNKNKRKAIPWNYREIATKISLLALSLTILLPLILPYYKTSLELGGRPWGEIESMLPRISSYFYPPGGSLLWNWLTPIGKMLPMSWEHQIFVGAFPLTAFIIMPVFYSRYKKDPLQKKAMLVWLTMSLLILLTLYFGFTLYKFVPLIPGMSGIRGVTRIILMNLFLLSIIIGTIITKISDKAFFSSIFRQIIVIPIFLLLIVLDQYVITSNANSYSKIESQNRLKIIENLIQKKDPSIRVFAYMPSKSSEPPCVIHLDAMLTAQNLNVATVNGYSGKFPPGYLGYFYDHYDRCEAYYIWMIASTQKYIGSANRYDVFNNVIIIGRDDCSGGNIRFDGK